MRAIFVIFFLVIVSLLGARCSRRRVASLDAVARRSHPRPSEDEDDNEDDEFADEELDKILAEAGDDTQLLRDCAVREAVTRSAWLGQEGR